jgi:hypothetical protein
VSTVLLVVMKFGKAFEKALEDEDIPEEWRPAAIQYKRLKVTKEILTCSY